MILIPAFIVISAFIIYKSEKRYNQNFARAEICNGQHDFRPERGYLGDRCVNKLQAVRCRKCLCKFEIDERGKIIQELF